MAGESAQRRDNFDRLFGRLPSWLTRRDDGAVRMETSHPGVQKLMSAIRQAIQAGATEHQVVEAIVEGLSRGHHGRKEKYNGR